MKCVPSAPTFRAEGVTLAENFMKKAYLELGQIVSTHGINGEIRLNPWCDSPEFTKKFKTLYFDKDGKESVKVLSARPHGNVSVIKLYGVDTVEEAAALRGKMLYFKRDDASLPKGTWFVSELLECAVVDFDDRETVYGTITDVTETGANDVWYVKTKSGEEVLIPAIKDVVKECDVENGTVYITPLRGLFDGEN